MGMEHAPETVWKAQELYCSDRLSFMKVSEILSVADSTLRRWADIYGWRDKREQLAQAEADIRADKVLARSKTLKALLDKPCAQLAFAVSSLEELTLKEAEAARQGAIRAEAESAQSVTIETPAEAVSALRKAVEQRLSLLLSRPEAVDLKAVKEIRDCLVLLAEMERSQPSPDTENSGQKGITAELQERLLEALTGGV